MAPLAGRRLAELLQEHQEPFLLDVYLLENGYSGRSVCTEATATCWPAGTACRRLQRLGCSCHGFQSRREGILGCLVGVFGRRRPPKAPNGRRGALEDGGSPSSSSMARKARSTCREDAGDLGKIKVDAERAHGWESTEEAKQLSPVSVLELQYSDDGSPAHDHAKEDQQPSTTDLHVQVGLHGSASSSSRYMRTIRECYGRRQALLACLKEGVVEEEEEEEEQESSRQSEQIRDQHLHESVGSHRRGKARRRQRRRAGDHAMAAAISHLAESDVWVYSMKWNPQLINSHVIMEIVAEVGDAILDELIDLELCLTRMTDQLN